MFMFLPFFFKNVILSEKSSVSYKEKVTQFEKMLNLLKEGDLVECVLFASENFDYNAEEKLEKAECKCQALFELRKEINLQIQGLLIEMAKESPLSKTDSESSHKEIRQLSDKLMKKYLKSLQISRQNQLCGKENQHTKKQSTIKFVNLTSLQNDGKEKNKKEFLGVGSFKMTFNPFEKYKQFEKEKRKESEEKKKRERLPYARTYKKKEESSITFDSSDEEREERIKKLEEKRQKLLQEIKIEMAARGITEEEKEIETFGNESLKEKEPISEVLEESLKEMWDLVKPAAAEAVDFTALKEGISVQPKQSKEFDLSFVKENLKQSKNKDVLIGVIFLESIDLAYYFMEKFCHSIQFDKKIRKLPKNKQEEVKIKMDDKESEVRTLYFNYLDKKSRLGSKESDFKKNNIFLDELEYKLREVINNFDPFRKDQSIPIKSTQLNGELLEPEPFSGKKDDSKKKIKLSS